MEHKLGEVFEDGGVKLMVEKETNQCHGCFFRDKNCIIARNNSDVGHCSDIFRRDKNSVIFVKVKDNIKNNKDMETRNIKLDLNTAKEWYKGSDETLKKLALQAYKEEELKDNLPNSWEEFCYRNKCFKGEAYIGAGSDIVNHEIFGGRAPKTDRNLLPSYKSAEAHLALMQLERLRDCYRDGWEPDWTDDNNKYVIHNSRNVVIKEKTRRRGRFLSFPTQELCDKFFDNFKELIETAKDKI